MLIFNYYLKILNFKEFIKKINLRKLEQLMINSLHQFVEHQNI
jgi:hypothetical protein